MSVGEYDVGVCFSRQKWTITVCVCVFTAAGALLGWPGWVSLCHTCSRAEPAANWSSSANLTVFLPRLMPALLSLYLSIGAFQLIHKWNATVHRDYSTACLFISYNTEGISVILLPTGRLYTTPDNVWRYFFVTSTKERTGHLTGNVLQCLDFPITGVLTSTVTVFYWFRFPVTACQQPFKCSF